MQSLRVISHCGDQPASNVVGLVLPESAKPVGLRSRASAGTRSIDVFRHGVGDGSSNAIRGINTYPPPVETIEVFLLEESQIAHLIGTERRIPGDAGCNLNHQSIDTMYTSLVRNPRQLKYGRQAGENVGIGGLAA